MNIMVAENQKWYNVEIVLYRIHEGEQSRHIHDTLFILFRKLSIVYYLSFNPLLYLLSLNDISKAIYMSVSLYI